MTLEVREPTEDELEPLWDVLEDGLGLEIPVETKLSRALEVGKEIHRVALDPSGEILGGLLAYPVRQVFGGLPVPGIAVSCVAVRPEARGRGVAKALMSETHRLAKGKGRALACLYPSTYRFYQSVGYARAGWHRRLRYPLDCLSRPKSRFPMRRLEAGPDGRLFQELLEGRARQQSGLLLRDHPDLWRKIWAPSAGRTRSFLLGSLGTPEAHWTQRVTPMGEDLRILDWSTPGAHGWEALVESFRSFSSMHPGVSLPQGLEVGLFDWLEYPRVQIEEEHQWMLRLIDVPKALALRGYPEGVEAELHLRVLDSTLAENQGDWILKVHDDGAEVQPGGWGSIEIDVRALASLYGSHRAARSLASRGWIRAERDGLELLERVFSGGPSWMVDRF